MASKFYITYPSIKSVIGMASQASLPLAFNIIFFITSLTMFLSMTKFLPQVDSRTLEKTNDLIQRDEGNKVTNSFGFNNNKNNNNKVKNMKQHALNNEMKYLPLPPFPNIPDMPFAPLPPFPFQYPFPPPFNIPENFPPFPNFPLPPFPYLPPFPLPPPA